MIKKRSCVSLNFFITIGLFFLYHSRKDSRIFEINIKDYLSSKISKIKNMIKNF